MKAVFAFAAMLASAATTLAQDTVQSRPFYLVAHSHDAKYNGTLFGACHEGAGIEGLCVGPPLTSIVAPYSTYNFNTSAYASNQTNPHGANGIITYELRGGNFNESQALTLSFNPTSNVAVPLFGFEYGTQVAFDAHNRLNIQSSLDDTTNPAKFENPPEAFYRWYICQTYYGYNYTTLAWAVGKYEPENPTCVKTQVVRVFL